jgi:transmembrane sensor
MNDRDKLDLPLGKYLANELSAPEHDRVWAKICARRAPGPLDGAENARPALPVPIAEALLRQEELTVARARMWRAVLARVQRPRRRPHLARPFLVFAGLVSAVAVALLVMKHPESWRTKPAASAAALLRSDGGALGLMEAREQAQIVRLSDASEIRLARGARLEPLQSSRSRFEVLLARGSAEFAVTPGGPRRWRVEAGAASVEVVGTVFRVDRRTDKVTVSVSRGAVLVRGENVPGRAQRVTAGQRLEVAARGGARPAASTTLPPTPDVANSTQAPEATSAPSVESMTNARLEPAGATPEQASGPARRSPARRSRPANGSSELGLPSGSPQERYAALGPRGMARQTASATSIETLLQLADIARLSGHPQDAVMPLTRALDAFHSSPQAALAAFTLGRVLLDQLDLARPAADAFERAIALHLPRALLPDCYRRLAEAYGRAGDAAARARVDERFRAAFGSGADAGASHRTDTGDLSAPDERGGASGHDDEAGDRSAPIRSRSTVKAGEAL